MTNDIEDDNEYDQNFMGTADKTLASLSSKVARTNKNRHTEITAVLFLKVLIGEMNGTFIWEDGPKLGYKFSSVFEAMAAKMSGFENLSLREKSDFIEENAPKLKKGFYAARKWLDRWYNATVFSVPQNKESSIPTVVTLNPDYMLECGMTAANMQTQRDFKLADGQIVASTRRLAASTKRRDEVKSRLDEIMKHAIAELEHYRPERE